MKKQMNIKRWLNALRTVTLVLGISFALLPSSAEAILCGEYRCNAPRKCVKLGSPVCVNSWSDPHGGYHCSKYELYRCIGQNETAPKGSSGITKSTNNSGKELSGQAETDALGSAQEATYTAFETKEIVDNHYKGLSKISLGSDAEKILAQTQKAEEGDEGWFAQDDTQDAMNAIKKLVDYANTSKGYYDGLSGVGDTNLEDIAQEAYDKLEDVYKDGYITKKEDYDKLRQEIANIVEAAGKRAETAAQATKDAHKQERAQETIADIKADYLQRCPTIAEYRARYTAGCWSCLVLEKLTSAFLHAANKGLHITQKAGIILLILGSGIWFAFWALKNVSSFTEIQLGNILNDLLKFMFKVMIAYWFIVYSSTAISKYLITPLMSVGAIVAQNFWPQEIKEYAEEWQYDEFIEDDDPLLNGEKAGEDAASDASSEEGSESSTAADGDAASEEAVPAVEEPTLVEPSSEEEIVQSLQKAFIAILEQQWREVTNSCGPSKKTACGKSCKSYTSCNKADKSHAQGHIDYVVNNIMAWAGYKGNNHYCQASVTAGMKKLAQKIGKTEKGKKLLHILNGAGAGCALAYGMFGYSAGQDIQICENSQLKYTKINVADTIWIHGNKGTNQKFGGGSGHHAVTALDNRGNIISFNGDSKWNLCAVYPNLIGKVGCISCKFRDLLKANPDLKNEIDTKELTSLAAGYNVSFVNYEGGPYFNLGSGEGYTSGADVSLAVSIPEVKYTGPTNIMPKSVMNSLLGAMRVITNTVSEIKVMGNMIMCYSEIEGGGAWHWSLTGWDNHYTINVFMWLEGCIIWCMGFLLVMAVAYYFLDISFKIGFAVLAIPLVMGLWPFGLTKDKLFIAISIIAKSSAMFAFMALTTFYGIELMNEALLTGGFSGEGGIYESFDKIVDRTLENGSDEMEEISKQLNDQLSLFSTSFILLAFATIYTYKLVQKTSSDLVNKFFPDKAFGDSSPMHSGATMMTDFAKKVGMSVSGANLARDIVAKQSGELVKGGLQKAGSALAHPMKSSRTAAAKAKQTFNRAKGMVNQFRNRGK